MKRLFFIVYFFIERLLVERSLPLFSVLLALVDGHIRRGSAWIRVVHAGIPDGEESSEIKARGSARRNHSPESFVLIVI